MDKACPLNIIRAKNLFNVRGGGPLSPRADWIDDHGDYPVFTTPRIVRAQALEARDVGTVDRAGTPEFAEEDETLNA